MNPHDESSPPFPAPLRKGTDCPSDPAQVWKAYTVLCWRKGELPDPALTPPWRDDEERPAHDFKADEPHNPACVIGAPACDRLAPPRHQLPPRIK